MRHDCHISAGSTEASPNCCCTSSHTQNSQKKVSASSYSLQDIFFDRHNNTIITRNINYWQHILPCHPPSAMSDRDSSASGDTLRSTPALSGPSSTQEKCDFKPVNFPPSEPFSPPPPVHKVLPGVVSARAAMETYREPEEQDDSTDDVIDEGVTLGHCLLAGVVLFVAMLTTLLIMQSGKDELVSVNKYMFDVSHLVNTKVVGQTKAVADILSALKVATQESLEPARCEILLLTGGPGVGKIYTSQVIKNHFYLIGGRDCKESSHIHLAPEHSAALYCIRRDFNLISTDTLFAMDQVKLEHAINTLRSANEFCYLNKLKMTILVPVLAIKALSIPELGMRGVDVLANKAEYEQIVQEAGAKVQKLLEAAKISSQVIPFRPLTSDDVGECIARSVHQQRRVQPSPEVVVEMMQSILGVQEDRDFVPVGCKDVDSFVALLPDREQED